MGFGIISSPSVQSQLKVYVSYDIDWHTVYGDVFKFSNVPFVKAWFRLPSDKHTADIYLNGIQSNKAFKITVTGRKFEFELQDASILKQPFTIQLEVFKQ